MSDKYVKDLSVYVNDYCYCKYVALILNILSNNIFSLHVSTSILAAMKIESKISCLVNSCLYNKPVSKISDFHFEYKSFFMPCGDMLGC